MKEIYFIDQTLRDAHQSLWATRMTTTMMYPVASVIDRVGFKVVDFTGVAFFEVAVRYLREDPWERIRLMSRAMRRTPLRAALRSISLISFDIAPEAVIELWIRRLVANGIRSFWIFDAIHDFSNISNAVRIAKDEGAEVVVALMYSLSPVHTDEYYAQKTREIGELGNVDAIYIEDAGGLLTPERVRTLVPAIQRWSNGLPLEIHAHCTTGLAPLVYLEAIKLGVTTVHTAISPLANGSSLPSTENILKNIRYLGYLARLDDEALGAMAAHFRYVAQREGLPMGAPVEYDLSYYEHQIPGGMITNLKSMLTELRMEHRLKEVLEEVALIRKELAYPVMATPFSQLIGTQAVLNIALGERYRAVPDEVIKYVLGYYGKLPFSVDQDVMDKIMSLPRTKDFLNWRPPQPSIADLRRKMGATLSDEELLLRLIVPEEHINAMLSAGPVKTEYPGPEKPVVELIKKLTGIKNIAYIQVQKRRLFSLTLWKNS